MRHLSTGSKLAGGSEDRRENFCCIAAVETCAPRGIELGLASKTWSEVRALMWDDVHLDEAGPYALFRESTTKDKDKRAVPLRPEVVAQLKAMRPKPDEAYILTKPIFWFRWPTYDLLRGDLKRAGIPRIDAIGRSVHFHSFRKTWQTLGVRYGIN